MGSKIRFNDYVFQVMKCLSNPMMNCCESKCEGWQQFRGLNPQTGAEEDKWECVHVMTPLLLIEIARQQRNTAAALVSHRNAVQATGDAMIQIEKERTLGG